MTAYTLVALACFSSTIGCTHLLHIKDLPPPPAAAKAPTRPLVVGVAADRTAADAKGYVEAIGRSLTMNKAVQRVVYPYASGDQVDVVADVTVSPTYDGTGKNFLINFPGFLVFAPCWYGYEYHANPHTKVELKTPDGKPIDTISWEYDYVFHQADIGRTWTEISWLEVGAIALIGGIVFVNYDTDQTPEFIGKVAPNYGDNIATLIANRLSTLGAP